MFDLQPGELVEITDPRTAHYGQQGTLVKPGIRGGWYIRFGEEEEGEPHYHPWGYQRVYQEVQQEEVGKE